MAFDPAPQHPAPAAAGCVSLRASGTREPHSVALIPNFVRVSFVVFYSTLSRACRPRLRHCFAAEPLVASVFFPPQEVGNFRSKWKAFQRLILLSPNSALCLRGKWEGRGLPGLGCRKVAGSGLRTPRRRERRARVERPTHRCDFHSPVPRLGLSY